MARMTSTAISDLVLALSVFWLVQHLINRNIYAALGFLIQGFAASAGVYRFSSSNPSRASMNLHHYLSWFAGIAGLPLIAVGFCKYVMPYLMNLNFMFSLGVIFSNQLLNESQQSLINEACRGFAMLTIMAVCYSTWNVNGMIASIMYILAGLIIGSEGTFAKVPRMDLLHYALVVGNYYYLYALY